MQKAEPHIDIRQCCDCKERYPLTHHYWYHNKREHCGFEYICKPCRATRTDTKRSAKKPKEKAPVIDMALLELRKRGLA